MKWHIMYVMLDICSYEQLNVSDFGLLETPGTTDEPESTMSSMESSFPDSVSCEPTPKHQGRPLWSSTVGSTSTGGITRTSTLASR